MIAKAHGLAILSVIKAGFLITARGGSGIVIARLPDGSKLILFLSILLVRPDVYRSINLYRILCISGNDTDEAEANQ